MYLFYSRRGGGGLIVCQYSNCYKQTYWVFVCLTLHFSVPFDFPNKFSARKHLLNVGKHNTFSLAQIGQKMFCQWKRKKEKMCVGGGKQLAQVTRSQNVTHFTLFTLSLCTAGKYLSKLFANKISESKLKYAKTREYIKRIVLPELDGHGVVSWCEGSRS